MLKSSNLPESYQSTVPCGWEHFPHVADIGLHGFGPTLDAAFEQAALAMTAVITDLERVRPLVAVPIRCSAPNRELLLADWLNAIVFEMATRRMLFGAFRVAVEDGRLDGEARGEPIDIPRHAPAAEVKGATLSELAVFRDAGGTWHARCVVDV